MIPYGRQSINQADIDAVVEVLNSDFLTQGPLVPRFEQSIAEYVGAQHAVAVNSATSALHLACRALGLSAGDILWTTPNTFVASANCALYCGASVNFVDIDPDSYNLSVTELEKKLREAKEVKQLPKILVPVHFAGQSCDMQAIHALAKEYGFYIIEDASHAIGADYQQQKVGNCQFADITVFSFHPVKIITTGEGGVAVTNDADLHQKMSMLRSHGISRDADTMQGESDGPWYYQQLDLGYNYRMTEMQAALGISQVNRLDEMLAKRRILAKRYAEKLAQLPVKLPQASDSSAWHLYVIGVQHRAKVFQQMRNAGIGVNVHYIPVHTQPYYQQMGFTQGMFPNAEAYYANALSLPLFPDMNESMQEQVIDALRSAMQ